MERGTHIYHCTINYYVT